MSGMDVRRPVRLIGRGRLCLFPMIMFAVCAGIALAADPPRERLSINRDWRFTKGDPAEITKIPMYDKFKAWPYVAEGQEAELLKRWILPSGNDFINDPSRRYARPDGNPGEGLPFVRPDFDDGSWEHIDLPHDWAIKGPFLASGGGGMGRLPTKGVGWYRKKLDIPAGDAGKSIFLDIDGAMSYAAVWVNGKLAGGWPFGYASWRLDITSYLKPGRVNVLAVRLDNPPNSSRWYPGAGIYRNVWLVKTTPVHVAQWGTRLVTPAVTPAKATVSLSVRIENEADRDARVRVVTGIFALNASGARAEQPAAVVPAVEATVPAHGETSLEGATAIVRPKLWGPPPRQRPNLYVAVTTVSEGKTILDRYETTFGIRSLAFDPEKGLIVNGQKVMLQGVNLHHDLGALGAAFNTRALERQLEGLREMGCNAVRTSHNPPTPELLELTDRMGFLVMDEAFDVWAREKTPLDYHLVYPDWHEQDLRAFVRRDRNHPSVIMWSIGNEVSEQYAGDAGAAMAAELIKIVHEEDATRPAAGAMNWAKPGMPFPVPMEFIALNYQGIGVRKDLPQYQPYHEKFPDKFIVSTESAASVSSRGEYIFPVAPGYGAPARPTAGEDTKRRQVSAYELYYSDFGSSPDKVFAAQDVHPYVGGEFVWTGWDYLGEPSPFDLSRSSYYGIIDLAGFKKDRFYLYQARWRAELPMAHLLPHWTWPDRIGQATPVHVFTSGDEAELFLNGKSLGRKKKAAGEYRLRWDDAAYEPGTLSVVAYKKGKRWATDTVKTAGDPAGLAVSADRTSIAADGLDLCFVTAAVKDKNGLSAPRAANRIRFTVEGPGEIVGTDSGDATSFEPFPSPERNAFNGLCLVIVRAKAGQPGRITVTAAAEGLASGKVSIKTAAVRP